MKYYIPAETINITNFLTTESISPSGFYNARGFGNRRYNVSDIIPNLDSSILLYSKYPKFLLSSFESDNAPLIIELDTDYKFKFEREVDGVKIYSTDRTIYFAMHKCVFWFQDKNDILRAESKATVGTENKYFEIFQKKKMFQVYSDKTFSVDKTFELSDNILCGEQIKLDRRINAIKGFAISYAIGAYSSVNADLARLKHIVYEMGGNISAIIASHDKEPTEIQRERLNTLIANFNDLYKKQTEKYKLQGFNAEEIWQFLSIEKLKANISHILQLCYESSDKTEQKNNDNKGYKKRKINIKKLKSTEFDGKYKALVEEYPDYFYAFTNPYEHIEKTIENLKSIKKKLPDDLVNDKLNSAVEHIEECYIDEKNQKPISELIDITDGKIKLLDLQDNIYSYFYSNFINFIIESNYTGDDSSKKDGLTIATDGGKILKDLMTDKWKESKEQEYTNSLRHHLNNPIAKEFNVDSCNINAVMSALAVFCQKGVGKEISDFQRYIIECELTEYKYALGLYGAVRGFAYLPKTFTNKWLENERLFDDTFFKKLYGLLESDKKSMVITQLTVDNFIE